MKWNLSWIVLFSFLAVSCGKMNTQPAAGAVPEITVGQTKATKNSSFYIYMLSENAKVVLGDNQYTVRAVHAKDLSGLTTKAKVTFGYWMPEMPEMGKSEETGVRNENGTYSAALFFSMSGRWEIIVKVEDDDLQDEYVTSISL